jgi:hypothetical protein
LRESADQHCRGHQPLHALSPGHPEIVCAQAILGY